MQIYIPANRQKGFYLPHSSVTFFFLIMTILIGSRWNLGIVLVCVSLMAKDEHLSYMFDFYGSFVKALFTY